MLLPYAYPSQRLRKTRSGFERLMRCSECLSDTVAIHEYDFGTCRQTGYHDAGEMFRCRACGTFGGVDELVAERKES